MLDKTILRQRLTVAITGTLLVSTLLWIGLLVHGALSLQRTADMTTHAVRCGPFILSHIHKQPLEEGFIASITVANGYLWYLLAWISIGTLSGYISARTRSRTHKDGAG